MMKNGSRRPVDFAECLETTDIRPLRAFYLFSLVIKTTVSTWPEFSQPMSDDRFFILRLRKQVNWFRSMREYIIDIEVLGNMSIEDK